MIKNKEILNKISLVKHLICKELKGIIFEKDLNVYVEKDKIVVEYEKEWIELSYPIETPNNEIVEDFVETWINNEKV